MMSVIVPLACVACMAAGVLVAVLLVKDFSHLRNL